MLKVNHVQKSYSHFHLDCSLEIKRGSITGIIGKNGSGKTTLFKAILNLIHIDSGDIILLDKDYKEVDKNKIGCTLANISLCEYLKLKDLVDVLRNTYQDFDLDYFLQKCNQYQFPLDKKINEFSTGMKAKLNVLIALSHHATFLILDEPTNGLDPEGIKEIRELLKDLAEKEEMAVLISSHNLLELETFCNKICIIKNGKVMETNKIEDVKNIAKSGYIFEIDNTEMIDKMFKNVTIVNRNMFKIAVDRDEVPSVIKKLVENDIKIYAVNENKISLEDAFLKKTGGNVID